MRKASGSIMKTASIVDFGGGWNVADAQFNLSSRFLTVADNVVIDIDNAVSPRPGYKLIHTLRDGNDFASVNLTSTWAVSASGWIDIPITGHSFVSGNHITISNVVGDVSGIPNAEINRTHGIRVIDPNTIRIQTRTTGSTASVSTSFTYFRDDHTLAGNIIEAAFFQNYIICMDDCGEIARVHRDTGVKTNIWNLSTAYATAGNPRGWGPCDQYSYDTWKQTMIVVNGRDNDKPIEINNNRPSLGPVQYLVDPATSSNTYVYPADYVQTSDGYTLLHGANNPNTPSTNTPTIVEISAEGTSGVFTGNPSPDDAVQVDLGRVTTTVDPVITGVGSIRSNVFVAFNDTAMLGTLGTYDGTTHKPSFGDQIPQHGSLNHRVIKNVGNDLFMCDYAGVPAFALSAQSGVVIPSRLSQLIDPALNEHFARLSEYTLRYRVWALINTRDRQYMLFVPKFDSASAFELDDDGIYCVEDFGGVPQVLVRSRTAHTVSPGDFVEVTGAVDMLGLTAANINGTRKIITVIDKNTFVMEVGAIPSTYGVQGGGVFMSAAPINDENIGYIYQFNPELKIRRWIRYRDLSFDCGCLSKTGEVYMMKDGKIYEFGTRDRKYYGDELDEWDYTWTAGTNYIVGDRVKQSSGESKIYVCLEAHTSSGTFNDDVATNYGVWEEYKGIPIKWVAEGPWSDYGQRMYKKLNKYVAFNTSGTAKFTLTAFVDNIYRDLVSEELLTSNSNVYVTKAAESSFVGTDAGGFGYGQQSYGLGNRTREQTLYEFPFECKLAKIRLSGVGTEPLKISGISFLYHRGNIQP